MQGDAAIAIFLEILADLFVQKRIAIHSASESSESLPLLFLTNKTLVCSYQESQMLHLIRSRIAFSMMCYQRKVLKN